MGKNGCKNPGGHWIVIFPGASISRYIFPGGKFAVFTFFRVADSKNFSGIIFFWGIELFKIKFQGIYESNNHCFQGVLVFQNLVIHTPVWIKNGIAQCHSFFDKISWLCVKCFPEVNKIPACRFVFVKCICLLNIAKGFFAQLRISLANLLCLCYALIFLVF